MAVAKKEKIDATITEYEQLLAALQKKVKRHYWIKPRRN
jgi:hypothetical protein